MFLVASYKNMFLGGNIQKHVFKICGVCKNMFLRMEPTKTCFGTLQYKNMFFNFKNMFLVSHKNMFSAIYQKHVFHLAQKENMFLVPFQKHVFLGFGNCEIQKDVFPIFFFKNMFFTSKTCF